MLRIGMAYEAGPRCAQASQVGPHDERTSLPSWPMRRSARTTHAQACRASLCTGLDRLTLGLVHALPIPRALPLTHMLTRSPLCASRLAHAAYLLAFQSQLDVVRRLGPCEHTFEEPSIQFNQMLGLTFMSILI